MQKAGGFGLDQYDTKLAQLLKRMARLSANASGNFNHQRRRYGDFILMIRDDTVVDINCIREDYCLDCLGTEITVDQDLCSCAE